jgi:hypothetical protein
MRRTFSPRSRWGAVAPIRRASTKPIASDVSRRAAKLIRSADSASSHCASSTAARTGRAAASPRNAPRNAVATARRSIAASSDCKRMAPASARRWTPGKYVSASLPTGASRSAAAAKARCVSLSDGVARSTRKPASSAAATPARHSVVFPIPAPPSRSSTPGKASTSPTNRLRRSSSSSRPTTPAAVMSCVIARRGRVARSTPGQAVATVRRVTRSVTACAPEARFRGKLLAPSGRGSPSARCLRLRRRAGCLPGSEQRPP